MKQKDIVMVLIPTTVLIILWIIFNILHSANKSTIPESISSQLAPIVPEFDKETINKVKERIEVAPLYLKDIPLSPVVSVTPTLKITQSPQATPGGSLQ